MGFFTNIVAGATLHAIGFATARDGAGMTEGTVETAREEEEKGSGTFSGRNGLAKKVPDPVSRPDCYNDIEHPDRVAPKEVKLAFKKGVVNLRAHSLTIVHVPVK